MPSQESAGIRREPALAASRRPLTVAFVPGAIVFAAALFLSLFKPIWNEVESLLPSVPYLLLAAGVFLGWRFNRSRAALCIIMLTVIERSLYHWAPDRLDPAPPARAVYHLASLLLPLGFLLVHRSRERGLFTQAGVVRLVSIFLIVPLLMSAYCWPHGRWLAWVGYPFFASPRASPMSIAGFVAFGVAIGLGGVSAARRRSVADGAAFWALLASFAAFTTTRPAPVSSLFLMAAQIILVLSVIETSFALAYRDELTGLPARRALVETFPTLDEPYAIAVVDIDHFKRINDRFGHPVGDQVLRMIAGQLSRVSGGGRVFRYGGEEFVVLFPGLSGDVAVSHIERVRKAIAALEFVIRGPDRPREKPAAPLPVGPRERIRITVSAGVAAATGPLEDPRRILRQADRALYRAKHSGRNQTCV